VLRVTDVRQSHTPTPTTKTLFFQPRAFDFVLVTGKLKKLSLLDLGEFPTELVKSGSKMIYKEMNKLINYI
jgi:hypothetical protein